MRGGCVADSGPSRWQLIKLGLGVFAFALFISCTIVLTVIFASQAIGSGKVITRALQLGQSVAFVACCLVSYIALWRYIRKRIVEIYGASSDEIVLQSRLRVAFWCHLLGWGIVLAANAWIVVLMVRELFRGA